MQRSEYQQSVSEQTVARARVSILIAAPLILLAAFVYHPHIVLLPDAEAVAHAVQMDHQRWAIAHFGVGLGAALMSLAYVALRGYLRDIGENRWSAIALPFLVLGSALYVFLPGMEFTVLAASATGGDIVAAQESIDVWFVPIMMSSALINAVGIGFLMRGVSRVLDFRAKPIILAALALMAISRLVPIGPVHFYVQGLAGLAALWPIAREIARRASTQPVSRSSPMPAT
ncbi:MAG: hypothetical protein ACRENU_04425 [Gemmatimonadaceae bacterium]